jgi:hypothetical protein
VLFLVHADPKRDEGALREVVERYKTVYRQESVLRVTTEVCGAF